MLQHREMQPEDWVKWVRDQGCIYECAPEWTSCVGIMIGLSINLVGIMNIRFTKIKSKMGVLLVDYDINDRVVMIMRDEVQHIVNEAKTCVRNEVEGIRS